MNNSLELTAEEQLFIMGVERKKTPPTPKKDERAALFAAIAKQNANDLKSYLVYVNLSLTDQYGRDAWAYAACENYTTSLQVLLDHDPARLRKRGARGNLLVHDVSSAGALDALQLLVAHGAEVDVANPRGYTPLMLALASGEFTVANYLLKTCHVRTKGKHSLFDLAFSRQHNREKWVTWVLENTDLEPPAAILQDEKYLPIILNKMHGGGVIADETQLINKLNTIDYKNDMQLLKLFLHHALSCDQTQQHNITWRHFVWLAVALNKLTLAKHICVAQLFCFRRSVLESSGKVCDVDSAVRFYARRLCGELVKAKPFERKSRLKALCLFVKNTEVPHDNTQPRVSHIP